jgi:protein-tyrosine phosphatase
MKLFERSHAPTGPVKSVLFVCTGNICRSPIAEAIARREAARRGLDLRIDSAGTGSWHVGESPCENTVLVCKLHDLDIRAYCARQFSKDDPADFELIVAMDRRNLMDLATLGYKGAVKLGEYGLEKADVPDPYYFKGLDGFHEVYEMVEKGVLNLFSAHFDDQEGATPESL